jgi:hypothetical protein
MDFMQHLVVQLEHYQYSKILSNVINCGWLSKVSIPTSSEKLVKTPKSLHVDLNLEQSVRPHTDSVHIGNKIPKKTSKYEFGLQQNNENSSCLCAVDFFEKMLEIKT